MSHSQDGETYVLAGGHLRACFGLGQLQLLMLFAVLGRNAPLPLYVLLCRQLRIAVAGLFNGLGTPTIYSGPNLGEIGNRILPFFLSLAATGRVLLFAQSFLDTTHGRAES